MIYYIDPENGKDSLSGEAPELARKSYTDLYIEPGDSVLFKRGSVIRDCLYAVGGEDGKYVTYGAYGEGNAPVFCGSVDVSDPADWEEYSENVWRYRKTLSSEVCNYVFDDGRVGATLRWEPESLCEPGDWYDSRMGMGEKASLAAEQLVLLYSVGNPGKVWKHIECVVRGKRCLVSNRCYTAYCDLAFFGSGVHALSGGAHHVTVERCSFCFIGGAVWNRDLRIRFGNAIEFWNVGDDILIEDCYFNNIYDSCVTQQGGNETTPAHRLIMRRNLFIDYGMGAYEGRDRMLVDCEFSDNICLYAGGGFTAFGDTKPRNSEIYPQPMGHHIFMWRIKSPSEGGSFRIKDNIFCEATGAAIYAIIDEGAVNQMILSGNTYFTTNEKLLSRLGERVYSADEVGLMGDEGARFEKPDISALIWNWFARSHADRNGTKIFTDGTDRI